MAIMGSARTTVLPTTMDTVQVAVELSMSASAAPTSDDEASLKTTIASELSVDLSTIRDFTVTSTVVNATTAAAQRRRGSLLRARALASAEKDSHPSHSVRHDRSLATKYKWVVSFSIVVSLGELNDGSVTSASAFESFVTRALDSGL